MDGGRTSSSVEQSICANFSMHSFNYVRWQARVRGRSLELIVPTLSLQFCAAWCRMSDMEVRYGLQPISDVFGHRREVVAPPHNAGLVPSQAPGQVAHGPPHYGQAN